MPAYGVYPIADVQDPGDEVSSTYAGRHITLLEGDLVHPDNGDGFVNKGDPIVSATGTPNIVGVAFKDGAATTDEIAIDTEGIWILDVVAANDAGNVAVAGGDCIYINTTTGVLSKITNQATQVVFGTAFGIITSGNTEAIAVKVHQSQSIDNSKRTYYTVTDGAYTYGKHHTAVFAGGQSTGLEYFDQAITGVMDGNLYGLGTWMELAAGFTSNGSILCPFEIGIYDAGATLTTSRVVMQQIQGIFASAVDSLHIWRVNIAAAGGAVTAVIAAANPGSVGYVADAVDNAGANKVGNVPLFDIVGVGVCYVEVFSA